MEYVASSHQGMGNNNFVDNNGVNKLFCCVASNNPIASNDGDTGNDGAAGMINATTKTTTTTTTTTDVASRMINIEIAKEMNQLSVTEREQLLEEIQ